MSNGINASILLKYVEKTILKQNKANPELIALYKKLNGGKGDHNDVYKVARILGKSLKTAYTNTLSGDVDVTEEIAEGVIRPTLTKQHKTISDASQLAQEAINKSLNVGLKAVAPELNTDKIDGIIKRAVKDNNTDHDQMIRTLGANAVNFCLSVLDDAVSANAEAHFKAGLTPVIVRKSYNPDSCPWCRSLVGTYKYPIYDRTVYQRHNNCYCSVTFTDDGGRTVTDVWTKKKETRDDYERRQRREMGDRLAERLRKQRELEAKNRIAKSNDPLRPATLAGVKCNKKRSMTIEEADNGKTNPRYFDDLSYKINCQTCVVAYEARLRGYDVVAKGNTTGSMLERLAGNTALAWIDPKTGKKPEYIQDEKANTPKRFTKFLEDTIKENERYTVQFGWKGRTRCGHIVNISREDGEIVLRDNQAPMEMIYKGDKALEEYFKEVKYYFRVGRMKLYAGPKLLRIDNLMFNEDVVNKILEKA